MIFVVDEDHNALESWLAELRFRGLGVQTCWNADDAYDQLRTLPAEFAGLAVIDWMLAVKRPGRWTRFGNDHLDVGIDLLATLCEDRPDCFPARAVIFTNSTLNRMSDTPALRLVHELGVPVWAKASFGSPRAFADQVERRLQAF